jgi:hypothetical protein
MKVGNKPLVSSCDKQLPGSKNTRGLLCWGLLHELNVKLKSVAHRFCAASFCDKISICKKKKDQIFVCLCRQDSLC